MAVARQRGQPAPMGDIEERAALIGEIRADQSEVRDLLAAADELAAPERPGAAQEVRQRAAEFQVASDSLAATEAEARALEASLDVEAKRELEALESVRRRHEALRRSLG